MLGLVTSSKNYEVFEGLTDLNDFSLGSSGGIQTPPLPSTPQPIVNTQANVQNVDPTTNLTSTETALLSPEEQVIRQRLRRT